jgi:chemotaxis receptor (MCP) glutamine deamidase CheD
MFYFGAGVSRLEAEVVGGDEKVSFKSETVIGTRTRETLRWQGSAAYTKDKPVLSSERTPHKNKIVTAKE